LTASLKDREKRMLKVAKAAIPPSVLAWAESVRGLGILSLAQIIASAGAPLSEYGNPTRLWKRMGLGIVNGQIQRKTTDKELAKAFGYQPGRRAVMHVVGDNLVKANGQYAELYRERKALEQQKAPKLTKMHLHRRALRYIEKCLLKELWQQWNAATAEEVRGAQNNQSLLPKMMAERPTVSANFAEI
jgi:hypothetical protein